MKRAVTTLTLLCGGLLFINPITNIMFAQNKNNEPAIELVECSDENLEQKSINDEIKENEVYKEETIKENVENLKTNNEVIKPETNNQIVDSENAQIDENNKEEIIKEEVEDKNTVEVIEVLNQQQAEELLKMYNKDVNYTFKGNENTFEILNKKGLSGYVFFPDYDTDLGFFVDKNSANIYYFHPSGYLELAI